MSEQSESAFWEDLQGDLQEPEFAREFEEQSRLIAERDRQARVVAAFRVLTGEVRV